MNDQPEKSLYVDTDAIRATARQMYQITARLQAIAGAADGAATNRTQQHFPAVDNGPETGGEWDAFKDQVAKAVHTLTGGAEYFGRSLEWTADDYEVSDGAIQDRLDRFRNDPPMAV